MQLIPWQRWLLIHALELRPDGRFRFRTVLILIARQNGKSLSCDTPILTANRGWTTMGEIEVGDEVFHPDGHSTDVTFVSDVMHDRECFRVTTTDGRSLVADADHLWTVTDKRRSRSAGPRGARKRLFETRTLTTREMLNEGLSRYASGGRTSTTDGKTYATNEYRFTLPTQEPIKSPDVDLPIDPYLFGAWLGDGTSSAASMTCHVSEVPHWQRVITEAGFIPTARQGGGTIDTWSLNITCKRGRGRHQRSFSGALRRLGVLNNKHVPDAYMAAGTAQREALLQGLMDTDGTVEAKRGQAEFCSTNRALAEGVLYLARSLGWRATLVEHRATLNGRDCGPKYRVCWTPVATDPFVPFRLPRKVARIKATDGGKGRLTVSIASIEPVESVPVRCIKIASPDGLYLAGRDLIATHNTSLVEVKNLWKMFVEEVSLIISVAQELDVAEESWDNAVSIVEGIPELDAEKKDVVKVNGKKALILRSGSRWKPKAAGRRPGRGLSGDDVNLDELREHQNYLAWAAVSKTTMARPNPQIWAFSNAGDDKSIVLNDLRAKAIAALENAGEVDDVVNETFGIFEWSAPDDIVCTCVEKHPDRPHDAECKLRDRRAWAQANPSLGYTITEEAIEAALATDPEAIFLTEVLCRRVESLEQGAIPVALWTSLHDAKSKRSGDIALGVDLAVMHDYGAINVYGKRADDLGHGQLIDYRAGTAWIVARLAEAKEQLDPIGIGMGRGTYEALKKALNEAGMYAPHDLPDKVLKERGDDKPRRGDILVCSGIDMAAACSQIINATRQRTYRVVPAQALDDAIAGGHVKTTGDSMAWARKDSRADICPIGSLTVARFCYETWSYLFANTETKTVEPFFAWA